MSSIPELSVSDFVAVFNQSLELTFPEVQIIGELSNLRVSKNRWLYFDLKDDSSSLKFFGSVNSLPGPLEDGMMLKVIAKPHLHPQFNFSLQVNLIEVSGSGSINKAYKLLKKKLQDEGLFDPDRKRTIEKYPENIALVTSRESAAYSDFIKIICDRWPYISIDVYNVQVQGQKAAEQIVNAINSANQNVNHDVMVVIRGGGSKDDLSSFDNEKVVRSLAVSRTPTIVAIGHERDISLSELVADQRASTPSNAVEILVPDRKNETSNLRQASLILEKVLQDYKNQISRDILDGQGTLNVLVKNVVTNNADYLKNAKSLLAAFDPARPLNYGYNLALNNDGGVIKTRYEAKKIRNFSLKFKDGHLKVKEDE